jgi:preprotein translocase subunit SecF
MEILHNTNFDFLGKTRILVTISILLIVGGGTWIFTHGLQYGVEFSGGTELIARFKTTPEVDRVRSAVDKVAAGAVIQSYGEASANQVLIRIPAEAQAAAQEDLGNPAKKALQSLATDYSQNPVLDSSSESVGPVVGAELRQKAIQLTVLGLLFQLIYIGARFGGAVWGTAATVAVFHDVIITLGLLAFAGYEITLNVIAALLTLVGYSVNDTIVIFDRVRENLRQRRKEPFRKIINDSINQTLSRTIISSGTTFLTVLGLYLFGGEVLRGFGFTMVIGIVVGTYSTIYIASPIVVWWHARNSSAGTGAAAAKAAL